MYFNCSTIYIYIYIVRENVHHKYKTFINKNIHILSYEFLYQRDIEHDYWILQLETNPNPRWCEDRPISDPTVNLHSRLDREAPSRFFFPLQLNLISSEIVLRSTAMSRRNRAWNRAQFGINPSSNWCLQMDLACCLHKDSQFINKKRNTVDKGCSKSLLE
jgi:hypothetical protein